jgi:Na+/glutamate symporter
MKFLADLIRNTAFIWAVLMVIWYLGELVEPGVQYAEPQLPCLVVALMAGILYTSLREAAE